MTEAAVLIPIFRIEGELHILFTQRSNNVTYHKGQISFPGGTRDKQDHSLLDTALRESWEELGLKAENIEILGELDDIITVTSNFIMSPFVASIPYPYDFKLSRSEIDEIFDIPIVTLMDEANFRQEYQTINNRTIPVYFYEVGNRIIWGATARIMNQLLGILQSDNQSWQACSYS